jgi:hypothetical protein
MTENPKEPNPHGKSHSDEPDRWESSLSYIDYAMDQKFFKRFWWTLSAVFLVGSVLLAVFLYFTGSTYTEARSLVQETQASYDRFEEAYEYFRTEDSLQAIKTENSHYYYYSIRFNEEKIIVYAMNSLLKERGFGSRSVDIDSAINRYLYIQDGICESPARRWLLERATDSMNTVLIGVAHNGMPQSMIDRVDSLFKIVYTDPEVQYIQDTQLPLGGFVYCVAY